MTLDVACFDRLYLNGYVARIQTAAATVVFLTRHRGNPIPSPALFQPMGEAFRRDVARFAREHELPVIRFTRGERKRDRMRPYLEQAARADHDGMVALGLAQENQSVWMGADVHRGPTGVPHYAFRRVMRRISVFYFYFHVIRPRINRVVKKYHLLSLWVKARIVFHAVILTGMVIAVLIMENLLRSKSHRAEQQ